MCPPGLRSSGFVVRNSPYQTVGGRGGYETVESGYVVQSASPPDSFLRVAGADRPGRAPRVLPTGLGGPRTNPRRKPAPPTPPPPPHPAARHDPISRPQTPLPGAVSAGHPGDPARREPRATQHAGTTPRANARSPRPTPREPEFARDQPRWRSPPRQPTAGKPGETPACAHCTPPAHGRPETNRTTRKDRTDHAPEPPGPARQASPVDKPSPHRHSATIRDRAPSPTRSANGANGASCGGPGAGAIPVVAAATACPGGLSATFGQHDLLREVLDAVPCRTRRWCWPEAA